MNSRDGCSHVLRAWEPLVDGSIIWVRAELRNNISLASDLLALALSQGLTDFFNLKDSEDMGKIARCDAQDRPALLVSIEPSSTIPNGQAWSAPLAPVRPLPYQGISLKPIIEVEPVSVLKDSTVPEFTPTMEPAITAPSGPMRLESLPHVPLPPARRMPLVIQSHGGASRTNNSNGNSSPTAIVDWRFCEKKAMEFELSDTPARFSLYVGHLTGEPRTRPSSVALSQRKSVRPSLG